MRSFAIKVPNLKRTADLPIRTLDMAKLVRMSIGRMTPLVAVGDRVEQGSLIAQSSSSDPLYKCAHAPFTSTVTAKTCHPAMGNKQGRTLELLNEQCGDPTVAGTCCKPEDLAPKEIAEIARRAGLVGMGGSMFPTYMKLKPTNSIDWVIVNGCESEPYVTCDHRVLIEHRDEVECGMRLAMRAVGAADGTIATDKNDYLDGYESRLTYNVLGRTVPAGKRPANVGVIIINVQTARALHRAVCECRTLTDRVVTVDGGAIAQPGSYVVPIGTEIGHVLHACGIDWNKAVKLIEGGPMMGCPTDENATVSAGTIAILALAKDEVSNTHHDPCIRCGRCQDVCAFGLPVAQLLLRPTNQLQDCIECGMCQFACPARRPMLSKIRQAKRDLNGQQP